tara:strand:- start:1277 stop:1459 length:183 start_codon:yes stop_codon:yes gene_type:complete
VTNKIGKIRTTKPQRNIKTARTGVFIITSGININQIAIKATLISILILEQIYFLVVVSVP